MLGELGVGEGGGGGGRLRSFFVFVLFCFLRKVRKCVSYTPSTRVDTCCWCTHAQYPRVASTTPRLRASLGRVLRLNLALENGNGPEAIGLVR